MKRSMKTIAIFAVTTASFLLKAAEAENSESGLIRATKEFAQMHDMPNAEYQQSLYNKILNMIYHQKVRPDRVDGTGQAALHWLAQGQDSFYFAGHTDKEYRIEKMVNALKQVDNLHADILNSERQTPLRLAIEHHQEPFVEIFIEKGADINRKDDKGNTPLHAALDTGIKSMVQLLLKNNAKTKIKNNDGYDSVQYARKLNEYAIAGQIEDWRKEHYEPSEPWSTFMMRNLSNITKNPLPPF